MRKFGNSSQQGLNGLSGEIPPSIAMLLDLEVINLSSNKLNGSDGAKAMKNLPFLKEIHLSHNFLSGNVGQLGTSESLRIVDLCTFSFILSIL